MADRELPAPRNKQVALAGDSHADERWTRRVIEGLAADGVDMVVQVGESTYPRQFAA